MDHVVIIGAGGLALEVLEVLQEERPDCDITVLSDPPVSNDESSIIRELWRGSVDLLVGTGETFDYVVAVGDPAARARLSHFAERQGGRAINVIHPSASIGRTCRVDDGVIILAGASVTAAATVGRGAVLNPGVRISHHCWVGEFVTLGPNAVLCGRSLVGDGGFIGAGAVVNPGVSVTPGALIGAGAVVVADIESAGTWVGVPARPLKAFDVRGIEPVAFTE